MIAQLGLVWAMAENGVIGRDGGLPWDLPDDLARFKAITEGHTVVMGRRTWESLWIKPLPNRTNIVVSRQHDFAAEGAIVARSLGAALAAAPTQEIYCIGGAGLFVKALPFATRLELTLIHADIEGDVYMPAIDWSQWMLTAESVHPADDRHAYPFSFRTFERLQRLPIEEELAS